MRPRSIVVDAPYLDHDASLSEGIDYLAIQRLIAGCCQTNANQSQFGSCSPRLGHAETAPLGQSGVTGLFEEKAF